MADVNYNKKNLVFGLDIGTRSIVGSVGYLESNNRFKVIAHYSKEHETRAMLDGQIHDIGMVSDTISKVKKELENQVNMPLKEVCIAAAGRVLKTKTVHVDYELSEETSINNEYIYSLESMGVEKAYEEIREHEKDIKYYCVGYTVIKYYLNDFVISNLEGHKGKKISADVLTTFLPEEVVTGLYTAVENAELNVANLTLEPIAAINIAIPQKYRLLNIALVDVGAGTSDISITKDGSIIAYGMIPRAGDEITETLVSKYLVEFNTAETIKRGSMQKKQVTFKDIMGIKQKVSSEDIKNAYSDTVVSITNEVADKIMELNGGKPVSAVFVVGGGGKAAGFVENIAKRLDIPQERVALRGAEVLTEVDFVQEGIKKDPLLVTPIGICMSFYDHKNNFIFVNVNGERIKLYDNDRLTVLDAAMQVGFPNEDIFPKRGKALEFTVNGEKRMIRGDIGEPAIIKVNNENANINTKIAKNDVITIESATAGEKGTTKIENLPEYNNTMEFIVNGQKLVCPTFVEVNKELQPGDYVVNDNDEIVVLNYYTLKQLLTFMDIDYDKIDVKVNNKIATAEEKVYENFSVDFEIIKEDSSEEELLEDDLEDTLEGTSIDSLGEALENITEESKNDNSLETKENKNSQTEDKVADEKNNVSTEAVQSGVIKDIVVAVNGKPVILKNKAEYIFVDILDFYHEFDTKVVGGTEIVTTINGEKCDFTASVCDGDIIELFWK